MSDMYRRLADALGHDCVLSRQVAAERSCSYWDQRPRRVSALVRPRSTAEVALAMRICHAHRQPIVVLGGLTGCVEGATSDCDDVAISLEAMNRVEEIDAVGRTATVQSGVVLQRLQEAASEHDLLFPLDLGARGSCTIGGNVSTNAGGINVIRYGMMRELVLGLEAVLADGTIVSSLNRMLKNNAGYDLKQLFIGSEGTLGVVTRVIVRLFERPTSCNSAMVSVARFSHVVDLLRRLQRQMGGQLSSFEVMWGDYFRTVTQPGRHRAPMLRDHAYYVMLQADGSAAESDQDRFTSAIGEALQDGLVADAVLPRSEAERRALWTIREDFSALLVEPPVFLYDVSLPIRDMESYVAEVQARIRARWPRSFCHVLGHIGDGNLHLFVKPEGDGPGLHALADEEVYEPLRAYGGSVSAEHGIGSEKVSRLHISRSPEEIDLMRRLKAALDPLGLLNPGKVLRP
jgi:FAD/FMN-containing dehydrogenase